MCPPHWNRFSLLVALALGCSSASHPRATGGSGGEEETGGSQGNPSGGTSGPATPSTGGAIGTGGATATGGVTGTGGSKPDASTTPDASADQGAPVDPTPMPLTAWKAHREVKLTPPPPAPAS
jgi:hypothetical protein